MIIISFSIDMADLPGSIQRLQEQRDEAATRLRVLEAALAGLTEPAVAAPAPAAAVTAVKGVPLPLSTDMAETLGKIGDALRAESHEAIDAPAVSAPAPTREPVAPKQAPVLVDWQDIRRRIIAEAPEWVHVNSYGSFGSAGATVYGIRNGKVKSLAGLRCEARREGMDVFARLIEQDAQPDTEPADAEDAAGDSDDEPPPAAVESASAAAPETDDQGLLCGNCRHPRRMHAGAGLCRRAGCYCSDFNEQS